MIPIKMNPKWSKTENKKDIKEDIKIMKFQEKKILILKPKKIVDETKKESELKSEEVVSSDELRKVKLKMTKHLRIKNQ